MGVRDDLGVEDQRYYAEWFQMKHVKTLLNAGLQWNTEVGHQLPLRRCCHDDSWPAAAPLALPPPEAAVDDVVGLLPAAQDCDKMYH
jgi:hypothetical protein